MSKFAKSDLTVDGNSLHVSMPFEKVDVEKRTVSGYATLDNIDSQGDVVLAEASAKAFARARGNLREMHKKDSAVGKIVDFREDEYLDPDNGGLYRGIFVTARVSEGAQDTWLKVLDGTLSGFSIGGEINDASDEFVKDAGRTVRFIKDYDLVELSLVDNPANQLANVFSIQKSATGSVTVTGMLADTLIESVFICKKDETVIVKEADAVDCPMCGTKMENAGWFESGTNRPEKVKAIVNKFLDSTETEGAPVIANGEGGVDMGTKAEKVSNPEEIEKTATTDEVVVETEVPEEEETVVAEVDETAGTEEAVLGTESPEEVADEETEISKKIDDLHDAVKESLEKTRNETSTQVTNLEQKIDDIQASFLAKASELEEKFNKFGEKLETTKSRLEQFEKSLNSMNSSGAFKKSADLEERPVETGQKTTTWNGAFSGNNTFSVDNLS